MAFGGFFDIFFPYPLTEIRRLDKNIQNKKKVKEKW
jgi:hypothetical protein